MRPPGPSAHLCPCPSQRKALENFPGSRAGPQHPSAGHTWSFPGRRVGPGLCVAQPPDPATQGASTPSLQRRCLQSLVPTLLTEQADHGPWAPHCEVPAPAIFHPPSPLSRSRSGSGIVGGLEGEMKGVEFAVHCNGPQATHSAGLEPVPTFQGSSVRRGVGLPPASEGLPDSCWHPPPTAAGPTDVCPKLWAALGSSSGAELTTLLAEVPGRLGTWAPARRRGPPAGVGGLPLSLPRVPGGPTCGAHL